MTLVERLRATPNRPVVMMPLGNGQEVRGLGLSHNIEDDRLRIEAANEIERLLGRVSVLEEFLEHTISQAAGWYDDSTGRDLLEDDEIIKCADKAARQANRIRNAALATGLKQSKMPEFPIYPAASLSDEISVKSLRLLNDKIL